MESKYLRAGSEWDYMEAREDCVVIVRRRLRMIGNDDISKTTVFYRDITSVGFKPEKVFSLGYLDIKCAGNTSDPEKAISGKEDPSPYCILLLNGKVNSEAEALKDYIESKVRETKKGGDGIYSAADEILKFKKLLDVGAISQAEFDTKKKQLLGI